MRWVELAVHVAGYSGVGWLLWQANKKLAWLQGTLVPWMNGISQRVGDDRPPIPQPPIKG